MKIKIKLAAFALLLSTIIHQPSTAFAQAVVINYQGRVTSNGTNFTGQGQFKFALVTSTNVAATATATANRTGNFVTSYTVTSGGNAYVSAPAVTISGGGGSGATAVAVVSNGLVVAVNAVQTGSGYTSNPTVTIAPPPTTILYTTYWSNDGTSSAGSQPNAAVSASVTNGLFTIGLGDTTLANMAALAGATFVQSNLQLRTWFNNGVNGFAVIGSAQPLTTVPYAAYAASVNGAQIQGTINPTNILGVWKTGGNSGTTGGVDFLGTTDNQPLDIKVNGKRAVRYQNLAAGIPNIIGGYFGNVVSNNVDGAVIGGGGNAQFPNIVGANYATVVGGVDNKALGDYSTAMGGGSTASGFQSVAAGHSTASGNFSTALGFLTTASGLYSTAMGRETIASGQHSTAIGFYSQANHNGSFVWADDTSTTPFSSTTNNQFLIRAAGGVGINTNNPNGAALAVNGNAVVNGSSVVNGDMTVTGNFKGGYAGNIINNGVVGAFIGGGGNSTYSNVVGANFASVVGGANNKALGIYSTAMGGGSTASGPQATAAGASTASGDFSTASGYFTTASGFYSAAVGYSNIASGSASIAIGSGVIASGENSTAMGVGTLASGNYSTAMGSNTKAYSVYSTAIGSSSIASNSYATAMGQNTKAYGDASTAMGNNTVASGSYSTAMGNGSIASGQSSTAMGNASIASGSYSTVMGVNANATHNSSFVFSGAALGSFASTADYQFSVRATGGFRLSDDTPAISFGSTTRQMINLYSSLYGIGVQNSSLYFRCDNGGTNYGFIWYKGGTHSDLYANSGGGTEMMHLVTGGLWVNGTFVSASDRNLKENFQPVDAQEVLAKVAAMPVSRWNYRQDKSQQHLGPMAQDFYAAFAVGPDDKHITTIDESGVALAAIQGLNQKLEQKDTEITALKRELESLKQAVDKLTKQRE